MINIYKKDIWWGYTAVFFNLAAGIIVLPIILNKLSPEEIGMNYLMLINRTLSGRHDPAMSRC